MFDSGGAVKQVVRRVIVEALECEHINDTLRVTLLSLMCIKLELLVEAKRGVDDSFGPCVIERYAA